MTLETFVYWLRGYLELAEPKKITAKQIKKIREHLDLLFLDVSGAIGATSDESKTEKTDAEKALALLRDQLQPYKLTPEDAEQPNPPDSMLFCGGGGGDGGDPKVGQTFADLIKRIPSKRHSLSSYGSSDKRRIC